MPAYTVVLLPNDDGSHRALVPALPLAEGAGPTRAAALAEVTRSAESALAEIIAQGGRPPREEWSPVRTVWVRNPRRGDTSPYAVMVQQTEEGAFQATPVAFTDVTYTGTTVEEAVEPIGPLLFQRLTELVAQGKHFPTQDDPQAYVIRVAARGAVPDDGEGEEESL